ncbi:MAG: hypothetical protein HC862_26270 [Scytonema sp. RU_4_4]|nr:hypothetical protein [Scytonema sp. RU_4_4]NJR75722.1 hypothetical protein [Scytonema sp. CRU_2_7]
MSEQHSYRTTILPIPDGEPRSRKRKRVPKGLTRSVSGGLSGSSGASLYLYKPEKVGQFTPLFMPLFMPLNTSRLRYLISVIRSR